MNRPAVCVVVPVYRAEATLDRCVQSVLSQKVAGGVGCVLVDDGSPDASGALCDAWAARDPRVRVIHQEDRGVSSARNAGMAAADSEFLVFLDSDDALRPGFSYRVVRSPLTYYNCSQTGTLSTRYHANYCEIWPQHFSKLNAACLAAQCPVEDLSLLHRAELTVYAEGVADILRRDPAPLDGLKRDKAAAALRAPWLQTLLEQMRAERCYSAYYLPCRWRSTRLVYTMAEAKRTGSPLYGKLDWAGYYLLLGRLRRD